MQRSSGRYFDLSTLIALGVAALLLISMPGGCGDDTDDAADDSVETESGSEPTPPPMMEIVDPEPADLDNVPAPGGDEQQGEEPVNPVENGGQDPTEDQSSTNGFYVVQPGDTLYGIAVRFGVSMDALMQANNMDDPNTLQIGQELQIPN
jgi:nucleoid-associated protein YgaU